MWRILKVLQIRTIPFLKWDINWFFLILQRYEIITVLRKCVFKIIDLKWFHRWSMGPMGLLDFFYMPLIYFISILLLFLLGKRHNYMVHHLNQVVLSWVVSGEDFEKNINVFRYFTIISPSKTARPHGLKSLGYSPDWSQNFKDMVKTMDLTRTCKRIVFFQSYTHYFELHV